MALDGIMLRSICTELNKKLSGGKVDRITQPEKDEINIRFRAFDEVNHCNVNRNLLISCNPSQARMHLTDSKKENPAVAPNFCMLLRKHLSSAKFISAEQYGLERVAVLNFECSTELYETVTNRLIVEIMGRCSNIIFTDEDYKIYDAVHQVDFSTSDKRQVLPGMKYTLPPSQNKKDFLSADIKSVIDEIGCGRVDKKLCEVFCGFAPLFGREISFLCSGRTDAELENFSEERKEKIVSVLAEFRQRIEKGEFSPVLLTTEKPLEYYCFNISQYGTSAEITENSSPSFVLDKFFLQKANAEHIKRSSADISKLISTTVARLSRKIEAQRGELEECEKAVIYKRYGDIITSNIYLLKGGEKSARLMDYYEEEPCEKNIELDPRLSPNMNAQRYYKMYKKAQTAKKVLSEQIPEALKEIEYFDSVKTAVENSSTLLELSQIRRELTEQGYIKKKGKPSKRPAKAESCKPSEYRSSDGFTVFVGKNNLQNDALTLKTAEKKDIWFHIKNSTGSHVVISTEGKEPPLRTLEEAAILAATFSSATEGAKVEVDYTMIKNVKKPNGAKPGMVIYETYQTAVVSGDKALADRLFVK